MTGTRSANTESIDLYDDDEKAQGIQTVSVSAVTALAKSELESQLDAAHRYPRSITKFLREATTMATMDVEIAEACIYSLPRGGKTITGPSVRLAEICMSAYGNMHVGGRVVDSEEREIVAQGIAWDLERNVRTTIEARRRITDSRGRRYTDDMITTTGMAAVSVALRNAVFRVIPRAYVNTIYNEVRRVAVGDAKSLVTRRTQVLERLAKLGVHQDRVLARLDKRGVDDIGLEELELLIGLGTSIKNGEISLDEAFPAPASAPATPEQDGKRISLKKKPDPAPEQKTPELKPDPAKEADLFEPRERQPGDDDR